MMLSYGRGLFACCSVAVLILAGAPVAGADPISWNPRLLPAEGSWLYSGPNSINDHGDTVGTHGTGTYTDSVATLWPDGSSTYINIATAFGAPAGDDQTVATAINNLSLIGGTAWSSADFSHTSRAILWDTAGGTFQILDPTAFGFDGSGLYGVNDLGQAVGRFFNFSPTFVERALFWDPGTSSASELPIPSGYDGSLARDINSSGEIAGWVETYPSFAREAVVWHPDGTMTNLHPLLVAAKPDISWSIAGGISESGEVVGVGWNATWTEAYAWSWTPSGGVHLLDRGGQSEAFANAADGPFIVGSVGSPVPPSSASASVWYNGTLYEIPGIPGFGNMEAWGVNAHGVVVGLAVNPGKTWWWQGSRAFVATPVPEPANLALVLLLFGVALPLGSRWRKHHLPRGLFSVD